MPTSIYDLIKKKYNDVTLHAIRSDADSTATLEIVYTLKDGFYRFVQSSDTNGNPPYDASVTNPTSVDQTSLPVKMDSSTNILNRVWRLTRQYGIKDGFTIVPASDLIRNPPGLGVTALDTNSQVVVQKANAYPIWTIRCDERIEYRDGDNIVTIYLFRILEVNTNNCWETNKAAEVVIGTVPTGQPPSSQLYQLILTRPVQIENTNSVANVIAIASDANIVRKYYLGQTAVKKDYIALQLNTDARDQGWGTSQRGLWSWFEIAILETAPAVGSIVNPNQIKQVDGKLCTWTSHSIPLTNSYTEQTGPVFDANHPLWKNLEPGNVLSVLVTAQFSGWKGDVRKGNLVVEFIDDPL